MLSVTRKNPATCVLLLLVISMLTPCQMVWAASPDPNSAKITILYDAFGKQSSMEKDWGFSALIEYGGKRILFDTGDNADIFAHNIKAKGIDLARLDFAVLSHRHGDHIGGVQYLLSVNPKVKISAPEENFGIFGFSLPGTFMRKDESLPAEQRYFDGKPPEKMKFGAAWHGVNFELIQKTTEIAPGIYLISLVSDKSPTLELRELSLALDTPDGMVLVVGCSHPGIERIVEAATKINKRIHLIAGGLHMVVTEDPEIQRVVTSLHDTWHVEYMAPGHCTGEPAFAALKKTFGDHYLYAGLGSTLMSGTISSSQARLDNTLGMTMSLDSDDLTSYRALFKKEFGNSVLLVNNNE